MAPCPFQVNDGDLDNLFDATLHANASVSPQEENSLLQ